MPDQQHHNATGAAQGGARIKRVEISVDACAQLGGQPYECIQALKDVYKHSGLRKLEYVDTQQGFREKSNGTTPETLFCMGRPSTRYGQFMFDRSSNGNHWADVYPTHNCDEFSAKLKDEIFPQLVLPVVEAAEVIADKVRHKTFALMQERGLTEIGGVTMSEPKDVPIIFTKDEADTYKRRILDRVVHDAIDSLMPEWVAMVRENPVLRHHKKNEHKGELMKLVCDTQGAKAIACALLNVLDPEKLPLMGAEVMELKMSIPMQGKFVDADTLLDRAHHFAHLKLQGENNELLGTPEVSQAIRDTALWPWTRKSLLEEGAARRLSIAHKNTADEAAVSYFTNVLAAKEDAKHTLFVLVTHDGPLIDNFVDFTTGYRKTVVEETVDDAKVKKVHYVPVPDEEYAQRGFARVDPAKAPAHAILTGAEFVQFLEGELDRAKARAPETRAFEDAAERLSQAINGLKLFVRQDIQAHGLLNGGGYAERVAQHRTQENEGAIVTK